MAEGYKRKCHLAVRIDIKQVIHIGIHESADHLGRHSKCRGVSQQIGYERAVVPAEMAIRTGLIFPRVAPVRAATNDGKRGMDNGWFARGSLSQYTAIVSC